MISLAFNGVFFEDRATVVVHRLRSKFFTGKSQDMVRLFIDSSPRDVTLVRQPRPLT